MSSVAYEKKQLIFRYVTQTGSHLFVVIMNQDKSHRFMVFMMNVSENMAQSQFGGMYNFSKYIICLMKFLKVVHFFVWKIIFNTKKPERAKSS